MRTESPWIGVECVGLGFWKKGWPGTGPLSLPFFLSRVWPDGHLDDVWQIQTGILRAGLLMNTEGMPVTNTGLREVIVLRFLASEAVWVPVSCLSVSCY